MNRPITRGKHEHVQLIVDQAQGLEAALTVFLSDVLDDQSRVPLEVVCQGEREAATLDVSLVLGRIEGDRHTVIVPTVTVDRNGLAGVKPQPGHNRLFERTLDPASGLLPQAAVRLKRRSTPTLARVVGLSMVFRSRIDAWLLVVLLAAVGASVVAAAAALRQASDLALLAPLLILAIGAALPVWILVSTSYSVEGSALHVRSGPFAWRIPLSAITSITPTHSPLSSPALSLRRLRVEYGRGKCILVSPVDQQAFIHAVERAKRAV